MPSNQKDLLNYKDDPDRVSQISVQDKYKKRKRIKNTRPEGNYGIIRTEGNPKGKVHDPEDMVRRRRMSVPTAVMANAETHEELAALTEKEENLTLTLQQLYFLLSKIRFLWFCAGLGSGKTFLGSHWAYMRIIENPETLGLIGANTHDQLNQSTLKPFLEFLDKMGMPYVMNKMPPKEWGIRRQFKEYDNIMVFPNGAHVLLRSLDKPSNLAGLNLGWFWIDETVYSDPKALEVMIARLRCPKSKQLMGRITSTPEGQNWLYHIFKSDPELYKIIFQSAEENPFLPDGFIRSQKAFLDPVMVQQNVHGRIVHAKFGRTYYSFNEAKNVKAKYVYDRRRELFLSWDFNSGAAPMSMIISQEFYCPKTGRLQIQAHDEIVQEYSDTESVVAMFNQRYGPDGLNHLGKITIYGDAYGDKTTSKSDYKVMERNLEIVFHPTRLDFSNITKGNPDEADRTIAMNGAFRNDLGQRNAFVNPKCKRLIHDLNNVKPKDGDGSQIMRGRGVGKINKANIALTHPSDAWGYLICRKLPYIRKRFGGVKKNNMMIVGGNH